MTKLYQGLNSLAQSKSLEDLLDSLTLSSANSYNETGSEESPLGRKRALEDIEFGLDAPQIVRQKLEDGSHEKLKKSVKFSDVVTYYRPEVLKDSSCDESFAQVRNEVQNFSGYSIEEPDSYVDLDYEFLGEDFDEEWTTGTFDWKIVSGIIALCFAGCWLGFCCI